ncbi:MAG: hypothetical protein CL670_15885 [Balneola sp.]|nr:hypothetical protein [Balneola sp.]MBE80589.1 hypothetical protein [Balneola sp.]MBE80641.1 hypothetical protein [Balneola sp.]
MLKKILPGHFTSSQTNALIGIREIVLQGLSYLEGICLVIQSGKSDFHGAVETILIFNII